MAFEPAVIIVDDTELVDKLNTNFQDISFKYSVSVYNVGLLHKGIKAYDIIDKFII